MLSELYEQPKSTVELGYMCPPGLFGSPAVTLTKKMKFKKWHASRERLPFRTPGSVPHFGTC